MIKKNNKESKNKC